MPHVTINGASVEHADEGRGTPIVFLHGAPSDHRLWLPHCAALSSTSPAYARTSPTRRSSPTSQRTPRAAARCVSGDFHTAVADATHMWPEERPQELVELVRRFLQRL